MTRYSQLYLTKSEPTEDSRRFRNRLASYCSQGLNSAMRERIQNKLEFELGVKIPYEFDSGLNKYFDTAILRDVLDTITIICDVLRNTTLVNNWIEFVSRVFKEENLSYKIDKEGIVHHFIDKTFEEERIETLKWLSDKRFGAVKVEFEKANSKLAEHDPDTKESVKAIFESLEILVKLFDTKVKVLAESDATRSIKPILETIYSKDAVALNSSSQILKSFNDWINAAHQYRHGQAVTEPAAPPLGLAILMVAQGTAFLRWLLEIYQLKEDKK